MTSPPVLTDPRRLGEWGLYTQRRSGNPANPSAATSPEDLAGEHFMLRVRLDGDRLTTRQVRVLAGIAREFARDTADLTDRANLQYHWVRLEDAPEIWRRLDAVGLRTHQAPGDWPRVIVGSPVAGIAAAEVLDASGALAAVRDRYLADPGLTSLPRTYRTSISWLPDCAPETNDLSFVGVVHPRFGPGFDLLVGGGLSVAPRMAVRLGAFVSPERVPEVWHAVTTLFADHGIARLGRRARLKYLVDDWGAAGFRDLLETDYLHDRLPDGPAAVLPEDVVDHVGVHPQHDGRRYVGFATVAGRVSGQVLATLADAAEAAGSGQVVFTPQQKVLVLDVDPERVTGLIDRMASVGLRANPAPWRRSVMACSGLEFCKLAVVDTKRRAERLVEELDDRLERLELDQPISVHLNGCPNSCARVQTADIGLKGQMVSRDGAWVEGFQVQLGGGVGSEGRVGRPVRGLKVASSELGDYIERLVLRYLERRRPGERFAQWARRVDGDELHP